MYDHIKWNVSTHLGGSGSTCSEEVNDQTHFPSICPNTYYSVWWQWTRKKKRFSFFSLFFNQSVRVRGTEWQPNYHRHRRGNLQQVTYKIVMKWWRSWPSVVHGVERSNSRLFVAPVTQLEGRGWGRGGKAVTEPGSKRSKWIDVTSNTLYWAVSLSSIPLRHEGPGWNYLPVKYRGSGSTNLAVCGYIELMWSPCTASKTGLHPNYSYKKA